MSALKKISAKNDVSEKEKKEDHEMLEMLRSQVNTHLDDDVFLFYAKISLGMSTFTPYQKSEPQKKKQLGKKKITIGDSVAGRTLLRVAGESSDHGLTENERTALMFRTMHIGSVLQEKERFPGLVIAPENGNEVFLHEYVIRACANAKIIEVDNKLEFDFDDLERLVGEIKKQIESK